MILIYEIFLNLIVVLFFKCVSLDLLVCKMLKDILFWKLRLVVFFFIRRKEFIMF